MLNIGSSQYSTMMLSNNSVASSMYKSQDITEYHCNSFLKCDNLQKSQTLNTYAKNHKTSSYKSDRSELQELEIISACFKYKIDKSQVQKLEIISESYKQSEKKMKAILPPQVKKVKVKKYQKSEEILKDFERQL